MFSDLLKVDSNVQDRAAMSLSDCLAKTYTKGDVAVAGRTVFDHCCIVGEVARQMLSRLPEWLRAKLFPVGSELVAAAHDIGKVSPCFQEKIYRGIKGYQANSISELVGITPELEKLWGYHGGVSQAAAQAMEAGAFIPEIVGQHHGYSPLLSGRTANNDCFGGPLWQQQREKLVTALKDALECDWPMVDNLTQAKVLSGLTTVSDWIGSSSWFEDPERPWISSIGQALDAAGFICPEFKAGLTFSEVFPSYSPHKAQQKLIEQVTQPGVYVMEAPMGYGKTEAALYAAYKVMAANRATGFYFALPTQLTSDKVYDRVHSFLKNILADHCAAPRRPLLLHSNAWLKETEMGEEGAPGGSWFQMGKRGILAPFAVGTIDQALMAVMNVKHGFVRAFGLAGKVVILDEVHSYDAYTGTLLNELIEALKELQCTVIILSATLTQQRRYALLGQPFELRYAHLPEKNYPLISAQPLHQDLQEIDVAPPNAVEVGLHICSDESTAIEEALLRAEQGQQVLWIENTVAEAQERYRLMSARAREIHVDCGLLHSRFLKIDRIVLEERWVNLYGKKGISERYLQGRILIGTQLLEQSLDIDADFLVTRLCPTDMLLQRLGRLWRHNITRVESAIREAWILAPTLVAAIENPKKAFGKTAKVYSPYVLCRSLEVWQSRPFVTVPTEIRTLIEATYSDRCEIEDALARYKNELEKKRDELKQFALIGLSQGGKTLPENKASTRYSEEDTVEVLLLHSYRRENNSGTFVTLLGGKEIYLPCNGKAQDREKWRANTAQLMQNTVHVANYLAPDPVDSNYLNWLKDYFYLPSQEGEARLRAAIVHPSGELLSLHQGAASMDYDVCYDPKLGYQAVKKS